MIERKQSVRCAVLVVLFVLSGAGSFLADGASGQTAGRDRQFIARQRDYQKRARRLMGELLHGVLQRHLKQLKENKMDGLPLYNDLKEMQKRSTALIGNEMKEAVGGRAWFTSLPTPVRDAVRSRGKTVTPKGYEELLRRYFGDQE